VHCLQLVADMRAAGLRPTTVTYNTLLTAAARAGQWAAVEPLFEEMVAARVPRDTTTYR
jgi:pentatricopeptide repeat protein